MRTLAGSLLILSAFALLAACGGGGGGGGDRLSEEEYFERVEELVAAAEAEILLTVGLPEDDESKSPSEWANAYGVAAEALADLTRELAELNAPENAAVLHTEFVDSMGDYTRNLAALAEVLDEGAEGQGTHVEIRYAEVTAAHDGLVAQCTLMEESAAKVGLLIEVACSDDGDGANDWETIDIASGISGELAAMPPLPDGLVAQSRYIEFDVEGEAGRVTIGLPLAEAVEDASGLAFYSYDGGEWVRQEVGVRLEQDGTVASGDFEAVPASLAVLREE